MIIIQNHFQIKLIQYSVLSKLEGLIIMYIQTYLNVDLYFHIKEKFSSNTFIDGHLLRFGLEFL